MEQERELRRQLMDTHAESGFSEGMESALEGESFAHATVRVLKDYNHVKKPSGEEQIRARLRELVEESRRYRADLAKTPPSRIPRQKSADQPRSAPKPPRPEDGE